MLKNKKNVKEWKKRTHLLYYWYAHALNLPYFYYKKNHKKYSNADLLIADWYQLFGYPVSIVSLLQTGINSMGIQYTLYPYCRLVSTLWVSSLSCIHIVDWYQLYGYPQYILYPSCRLVSTLWVSSIYCIHIVDWYQLYEYPVYIVSIM